MRTKIISLMAAAAGLFGLSQQASALPLQVYFNDFEINVGPEWSDANRTDAPTELGAINSYYHGNYSLSDSTTLTLTGLPTHTQLSLQFDLYLFNTWDGENTRWGKDFFSLSGDIEGSWTFTNHQPEGQSYPGSPDLIPYGTAGNMGATYVYLGLDPTGSGDEFLISHTSSTFTVTFGGPTTQTDEWWGIDNVRVTIDQPGGPANVSEPAILALLGVGLAGIGYRRKCQRKP